MNIAYTEEELPATAAKILANAASKTLCFYGEMGAGKTTLIKAMVKELEGADPASSPTFGLVNEYHTTAGELLGYHFDFYRIEEETEALDMGLEDYLYQDVWIFIEWPEKITSLLPANRTEIHIEIIDRQSRRLEIV
ncbi:tRNA (adenosine(37)-N6)-threonylcarbamoyltransferase complex ATPase subunit type 1 TsaE [Muriicola sp. Z0-33]|uniref:tRNA (adenosine(37)-N6)-threonylcarbamoyltransferase complex ATPase subunit type 1 TsaE n=1 Tax=Muriicola sp. Z0-33 TaxID=2816957 RepID=UPI0022390003|nr:tRNA (adenosine(37)-N6)-threonylcarbamoyltransferase complex ATPase subunit type 1 TsaE [Muriicola sp. Z0-33]MCW5516707.1 tRNA (adenosine(37)-N6)-threonylcarbamoyltransferase complex ATPase subunit type 1 TsaE [Muriicola sp. Z0-33]